MTRLTTATYVKIILVILLCLVLCGGIFSCSVAGSIAARHAGGLFWGAYESSEYAEAGDVTMNAADVRNIEIDWPAGSVTFDVQPVAETAEEAWAVGVTGAAETAGSTGSAETTEAAGSTEAAGTSDLTGELIALTEVASVNLPDNQRMRWELQGDTLKVGYGWSNFGFMGCSMVQKNLIITIPESAAQQLGSVVINGASGSYDLGSIGCDRLEMNLASGQVSGDGMRADRLSLDVASGTVRLNGDFSEQVSVSLASGGIDIDCTGSCPRSTDVSIASGTMTLGVPASSGVSVAVTKLSGSFTCDFPSNAVSQNADGWYVVGDGTASFNADIMSGQVTLRANGS